MYLKETREQHSGKISFVIRVLNGIEKNKFGDAGFWFSNVEQFCHLILALCKGTNPSQATGKHHLEAIDQILSRKGTPCE